MTKTTRVASWTLLVAVLASAALPAEVWARRMIRGTILTPSGQPATGVTVSAFDEDGLDGGEDERMGTATTDAQGTYSIGRYVSRDWDTRVPGSDSFRPDIYIKVYEVIYGREVAVGRSTTHDDHPQGQDLTIDLRLRGIKGTVWDRAGSPARGIGIKAFDEDALSADDRMNEARTDANGAFVMTYEQKYECEQMLNAASCWDPPVPGSVSWRPDVYIEAHAHIRGRLIKVNNKSVTTTDVPHRNDVYVSETVPLHDDIDYVTPDPWGDAGQLHVLAYNIYLRPTTVLLNGQALRVPYIVREIFRDKYDVIVFSEAFADSLREELRVALEPSYPYHAKVPETDNQLKQDGGVKILSRWPIENGENLKGEYRVFGEPCLGWDCNAEKGVVYVKINKNGTRYHVFGTHVQADEPPSASMTSRSVRGSQFQKIRSFIDEKNIPVDEAVVIAGDLNVDQHKSPEEYAQMLETLNAGHPQVVGHPYSIDGRLNDLNDHGGEQELLDYVLYSRGHRLPATQGVLAPGKAVRWVPSATNRVMFYRSDSPWREFDTERYRWDISDHYPVFGRFRFVPIKGAVSPVKPSAPSSLPSPPPKVPLK